MELERKAGFLTYLWLAVAYLLQFAIWGSWNIALGGLAVAKVFNPAPLYSFFALGALVVPLICLLADFAIPPLVLLAIMHLIGGFALCGCHFVASADVVNVHSLAILMFIAGAAYMPTIALINTVAFQRVSNKLFPLVYVFGTVGWFLVNRIVYPHSCYLIGGLVSGALVVYSVISFIFFSRTSRKISSSSNRIIVSVFDGKAFLNLMVFLFCVFLVSIFGTNFFFPMFGHYLTDFATVAPDFSKLIKGWNSICQLFFPMFSVGDYGEVALARLLVSWSQLSEFLSIIVLPLAVLALGLRGVSTLGMLAWSVLYAMFAIGSASCVGFGVWLRGLAYAFLCVAAYMYVERSFAERFKATAQGVVVFLLLGVAQFCSGLGYRFLMNVSGANRDGGGDWTSWLWFPAIFCFVFAFLFVIFGRDPKPVFVVREFETFAEQNVSPLILEKTVQKVEGDDRHFPPNF